ncbi:MAG: hypothetical protein JNM07_09015 [Phycisphaerae bacterium]|nr:hypothetical protein [Phycisphaerae bacterium]
MNRRIAVVWLLATASQLAVLAGAFAEWSARARETDSARARLAVLHAQASERRTLLAASPRGPMLQGPPPGPLAPRVTGCLEAAGVAASALDSLSGEAESSLGGEVKRRRATLSLAPLTLPQMGAFLDAWRTRQAEWTPVAIDLAPISGERTRPGADLPLRAQLVLEVVYLDEKEPHP